MNKWTLLEMEQSDVARFWSKVATTEPDACWNWQKGKFSRSGYGSFWHKTRSYQAHRIAYMLEVGSLDAALEICHSCDNPPCCNPRHLFQGTHAENISDAATKHRMRCPNGEAHHNSKLNGLQVALILSASGKHRDIAKQFGISQVHVSRIKRREAWTHV